MGSTSDAAVSVAFREGVTGKLTSSQTPYPHTTFFTSSRGYRTERTEPTPRLPRPEEHRQHLAGQPAAPSPAVLHPGHSLCAIAGSPATFCSPRLTGPGIMVAVMQRSKTLGCAKSGGGATLLGTVASRGLAGQGLWGKAGPASWENGVLRLESGGGLRQESALQVFPPNPAAWRGFRCH